MKEEITKDIMKLGIIKTNWEAAILNYHRDETLPHRILCNSSYIDDLDEDMANYDFRKDAIETWQNEFCNIYPVTDSLAWDQNTIKDYNNTMNAIQELANPKNSLDEIFTWIFNNEKFENPIGEGDGYSNPIFSETFGKAAENFTFSGNTSTTKTFKAARSRSSTFSSSFFVNPVLNVTAVAGKDEENIITGVVGPGFLSAKVISLGGIKTKYKVTTTGKITYTNTSMHDAGESVTMSYTLSDDDLGDQHSVTVVSGVSPTHSPYFYRFGGRSSCPPETGDIIRDDPKIQIIDPETGAAKKSISLYNQDPEKPAVLTVQITNNSPFNEDRAVSVFLKNTSNSGGAVLKMAGNILGKVDLGFLPPGIPQLFTLTIEKNLAYRYDNLSVGVVATCGGVNQNKDFIDMSVQFETPCSPITIVSPNNNWVVNGINDPLVIKVRDYQPDNPVFKQLALQYRRAETGADWHDVTLNEILLDLGQYEENIVAVDEKFVPPFNAQRSPSKDFLAALNEVFIGTPSFPFTWIIPVFDNENPKYPDGIYEIRVAAQCDGSENFSNVISGSINRAALRLLSTPEPADGLWLNGDRLQAEFNQDLDCSLLPLLANFDIKIIDKEDNQEVLFTPVCSGNLLKFDLGTEDNFTDDFSFLQDYDGHQLEVIIAQATAAESGNQLTDTIRWQFDVVTQKLFWATDTINVELYADETLSIPVDLIKTVAAEESLPNVTLMAKGSALNSWLSIDAPNAPSLTFNPNPTGKTITFNIDGSMAQGEIMEEIEVNGLDNGNGNKPKIVIKAKIFNRPPAWTVNTSDYNQTMNLITNWRFTEDSETFRNVDTMDIISVWIEGKLRGVGRIEFTGSRNFYAAYLSVYGTTADKNKALEFRIWDAASGIEYLGNAENSPVTYINNKIVGTTENPQMLLVDRVQSEIRTIPLKQGWTGFSINFQNADNSLTNLLASLTKLTTGDKIKSRTGGKGMIAEYTQGIGWVTSGGETNLSELDPAKGYQIYMKNGPDTLYVTGADANLSTIETDLVAGWNWIGFPLQDSSKAENSLNFLPFLSNTSILKTINRITPNGEDVFMEYTNNAWSPLNKYLKPYDFIKIKVANAAGVKMSYNTPINGFDDANELPLLADGRNGNLVDPMEVDTWVLEAGSWEYQLPLIATLSFNGVLSENPNDRLAVFKDGELRGLGHIEYISAIDKYVVVISVGGITTGEIFQLYYYNATEDKVYAVEQSITLDLGENEDNVGSLGYGKFSDPYPIEVALFSMTVLKQDVFCASDNTGAIEVTPVGAFAPTYAWSHDPTEKENRVEGLSAGTYTVSITDIKNIPVTKTIEIINQSNDIIAPTVIGAAAPICLGACHFVR